MTTTDPAQSYLSASAVDVLHCDGIAYDSARPSSAVSASSAMAHHSLSDLPCAANAPVYASVAVAASATAPRAPSFRDASIAAAPVDHASSASRPSELLHSSIKLFAAFGGASATKFSRLDASSASACWESLFPHWRALASDDNDNG
ncbi:hypothetical protein BN946_scf185042.g141 [Trametes cinnabarina]|uniref:Uncharacterized protein n=1 Tax=Pycnoporus cinnabarinus TaxID=5643 RepID=A0A060SAC2_PYCCI|nr:hypothetical protein BN946_scf185042.g141 [Trametes cinnabarina]